ncbi:MAG: flagellar biosynthesis protein FlhA [Tissierellales bacterium]|nr:flagellar biosynthesis protein FlhA [Tissierellales bacterium]
MTKLFNNVLNTFSKYTEAIIGFLVVGIIGIIIIPMPAMLLDFLLVSNITIGIIILLLTLSTKNVLEFSTFPTLLLITTLFRLSLNISSTRLILSEGNAGNVINAFGNFVTGNNYIVGAVIFLIIVIVQLVVITNGASRVSEVSARFTLDAMPGKQMAIDADLNTGLIDEQTAKQRRLSLQREADFYGAMDGASKFVKGDAIAGIIITVINLVGGILIFTLQHGISAMEALDRFGKLTIGDGLVSQIPALLISISSGILVTRSEDGNTFGKSLTSQIFSTPDVLMVSAVVLLVISLVPAFPTIPFLLISLLVGSAGYLLKQNEKEQALIATDMENIQVAVEKSKENEDFRVSQVEPIALEIGYGLIPLVDEGKEENLVNQITAIRRQCSNELGIIVNSIRIRDNLQLQPNDYVIKIKGNIVASGSIYLNKYLVLDPGTGEFNLEGIPTKEPAFGIDAIWIDENQKDKAELEGYTIIEPSTILVTHLKEVIKEHSHELLGRQEVKQLLDSVKEKYDVVVDELIPDIMTLGEVQKVLQGLLKEKVPITDLVTILETLADNAPMIKDTEMLIEQVRQALKRTITKSYLNSEGKLPVITLHPSIEEIISENTQKTMSGSIPILKPDVINKIFDNLNKAIEKAQIRGIDPIILTSPKIRVAFRNLISYNFPNIPVISITEIPNEVEIEAVGMVEKI